MNERIVIITGAHALAPHVVETIEDSAIILAVDGGLDHALAAGLTPSGLIGDLDSVSAAGLEWATEHATISRHPADKDRTDTELALSFAAEMLPNGITLIGGGSRLDHTIAALGALGALELTTVPEIDAWWDGQHVDVIHGPGSAQLHLEPGSTLSLLALQGPCAKVSLSGVRWELDEALLSPIVGLGVSNVVLDTDVDTDTEQDAASEEDRRGAGIVDVRVSTGVLTIFDQPTPRPSELDLSTDATTSDSS